MITNELMWNTMLEIKEHLDKAGIEFWLEGGSLLFPYREEGALDLADVDLGVMLTDYDKILNLMKELNIKNIINISHIWDKEISIFLNGIKIDFIFCTIENDKVYTYAYRQNPDNNMKWNLEFRMAYPKEIYLPLSKLNIKGIEFNTPFNVLEKLSLIYGDWKTPVATEGGGWNYDQCLNKDLSYHPIAICMTTFLRDDSLMKMLPSYLKYPVKLYILDQGNHSAQKDDLYENLRQKGHWIQYADFDCGLSRARNIILKEVKEPYVIITEDDLELLTNPYQLLSYFNDKKLGILGGLTINAQQRTEEHYEYRMELKDGVLRYIKADTYDIVQNFFIARTTLFKDVQYDEVLKLAEHTDFFLQLQKLNKWNVSYTRNFKGNHYCLRNFKYSEYRSRQEFGDIMHKKWNIREVIYE